MTTEEIKAKIAALGPTTESALEVIRREGIKGRPGWPCGCIIARQIFGKVPPATRPVGGVVVWRDRAVVRLYRPAWDEDVPLPDHLAQLARDFDNHAYPDLEE